MLHSTVTKNVESANALVASLDAHTSMLLAWSDFVERGAKLVHEPAPGAASAIPAARSR